MNLRAVLSTLLLLPALACGGSELDVEHDEAAALSDRALWAIDPALTGPQCGLYRGGTTDGAHMIASPNPALAPSAIGTCSVYCMQSGHRPGDICIMNRQILGFYGYPAPTAATTGAGCGLYRGGVIDAQHMVASPNPASSVAATDAACNAYCRDSDARAGDICVRNRKVINRFYPYSMVFAGFGS